LWSCELPLSLRESLARLEYRGELLFGPDLLQNNNLNNGKGEGDGD